METQNWLLKQAATQPEKVAVTDGARSLTFRQLADVVRRIVSRLDQLYPGPRVGMLATNSLTSYEIALAILSSGRTIV